MGYHVDLLESTFVIPSQHLDEAYQRFVALNTDPANDSLKGGGGYCWGWLWMLGLCDRFPLVGYDSERPPGLDHHPARNFSWMHEDWPRYVEPTAEAVLEELGFITETVADDLGLGVGIASWEGDKDGDQAIFLDAVADLATGQMFWRGEDDDHWGYDFDRGTPLVYDVKGAWRPVRQPFPVETFAQHPVCPACGADSDTIAMNETTMRFWRLPEVHDGELSFSSDDDVAETGDGDFIDCSACHMEWEPPETVEYR